MNIKKKGGTRFVVRFNQDIPAMALEQGHVRWRDYQVKIKLKHKRSEAFSIIYSHTRTYNLSKLDVWLHELETQDISKLYCTLCFN